MSSETSMMVADFRLQEWAAQIRECQNRPVGMSITSWCACYGITKENYYYRLCHVGEACFEVVRGEMPVQQDDSCAARTFTAARTQRRQFAVRTFP